MATKKGKSISYMKLWHLLLDRHMSKNDLRLASGISTQSLAKMNKGENLQTDVLLKICNALDVTLNDIMDTIETETET
ncbi:transcriptional regulator [Clostridia bacterium]|nr:transcriptional regulator [Clostridia bacterium]